MDLKRKGLGEEKKKPTTVLHCNPNQVLETGSVSSPTEGSGEVR